MNPSVLTVYKAPYPKKRIGKDNDGGYVIVDIPDIKYSLLVSGGISTEISFEEEFINTYDVNCIAFDGAIDSLPTLHSRIQFNKKNIVSINDTLCTNLHDLVYANDKIFVKINIDGNEIPWIQSLDDIHLNKLEQIVIVFHSAFGSKEEEVFNKLNKNHNLVHFHGNNCADITNHKGIAIPNIFECTYLHKKYFLSEPELNNEFIPSDLDMANCPSKKDIEMNYPPFVCRMACMSKDCPYLVHLNVRNNGGKHCCNMCRLYKRHGPLCNRQLINPVDSCDTIEIHAITVCVNYSDILKHMLVHNATFLKMWYIVTEEKDTETIALIQDANLPNVQILLYTGFYKKAKFNFGGARLYAQNYIHDNHASCNILFLDADIYLPSNFREQLPKSLLDDTIYGVKQRLDYWTLDDFLKNNNRHYFPMSKRFVGFFQLYKQNRKYLYKNSDTCGRCDLHFRDLFQHTNRININISVKHLGREGENWCGRKSKRFDE